MNDRPTLMRVLILMGYAAVSFLVNLAAYALGYAFLPPLDLPIPLLFLGILFLLCMVSYLRFSHFMKTMDQSDLRRMQSQILEQRAFALENYEEYQRSFRKVLTEVKIFIVSYFILALTAAFTAGALTDRWARVSLFCLLLAFYIIWGILQWNHKIPNEEPDPEMVLNREEYPAFYQLLDSCFPDEKKPPYLLMGQRDNVGVTRVNGRICVMLGVYQASVFFGEELHAVLLHEKSHLLQDLDDPQYEAAMILNRHDVPSEYGFFALPVDYLLLGNLKRLEVLCDYANVIINEEKERRADLYSMEQGNGAAASSALFKTRMLELYFDFEDKGRLCYTGDTAPKHLILNNLQDFFRVLPERKDFWQKLILNELPPRIDTHPIVRKRWESMGSPAFTVEMPSIFEKGGKSLYEKDQLHFIEAYDVLQTKVNEEDYEDLHKELYTDPMAILQTYETDVQSGKTYTTLEMRPVLDACSKLEKNELLNALCRKAITLSENDHDACHANYLLGNLLVRQYDPAGVSYLYKAAETNTNYTDDAMDTVGDFLLLMNMPQEMEIFREKALVLQQSSIDNQFEETGWLSKGDRLSEETDLPAAQREANISYIVGICGSSLQSLYQVNKQITDDFSCTFYLTEFKEGTPQEDAKRFMEQVFEYLDSLEEQYTLMTVEELSDIKPEQLPGKIDLKQYWKHSENTEQ